MGLGLNYFDAIIYINLSHREDRNDALLKELQRLKVDPKKIYRIDAHYDLLNGHRGCALSHTKAIQFAIDHDFKNALFLEDDFISTKTKFEIDPLIDNFIKLFKEQWDVFFIGGNIKKYTQTRYPNVKRALSSQCAHAYAVNHPYFQSLLSLFIESYNMMENDLFFFDSVPKAIDQKWDELMQNGKWYFSEIFAQQRASFSDIDLAFRDRKHQENFSPIATEEPKASFLSALSLLQNKEREGKEINKSE